MIADSGTGNPIRRRWGNSDELQKIAPERRCGVRCDPFDAVEVTSTSEAHLKIPPKTRWRNFQASTDDTSHRGPVVSSSDAIGPTAETSDGTETNSGVSNAQYWKSFKGGYHIRDPIEVLLQSSVLGIVTAPPNNGSSGGISSGETLATIAARRGLFPNSRVSSPWQLLLEDGLARDCQNVVLGGGAYHIREALCKSTDLNLFDALRSELGRGIGAWSRGSSGKASRKWSLPGLNGKGLPADGSFVQDLQGNDLPITTRVLRTLSERFDAECLVWWLNLYEDGWTGRSFHHDDSASDRGRNITIGGSFGAMRTLTFRHNDDYSRSFDFAQWNGDLFAFRESVNRAFEHAVFPLKRGVDQDVGPRISVIIMGRAAEQ